MRHLLRGLPVIALLLGTAACPGEAVNLGAPAPELAGIDGWINSPPLTMDALRGKVVLVNFWTFGCSNCRNTLSTVKRWHEKYRDRGLVVLSVHTPELEFERKPEAVAAAVREHGIAYPVAIDGSYATWRAFENHYWPAFYFVDKRGVIRHARFGEGGYDDSERWIEKLLSEPL
ncbi:MAG TPA: redoxin domain-containing protein [Myxococcota bacterium]|nr:redoxin domain-containing protein [Myxococcota bacterium]